MQLFVVFSMRRGGQHGIINWICTQHGSITHLNNVILDKDKTKLLAHPAEGFVFGTNPVDVLINLEDFNPAHWQTEGWPACDMVKQANAVHYILVVRRFRNWLASLVAWPWFHEQTPTPAALNAFIKERFEAYARSIQIARGWKFVDNLVVVRFDDWFVDPEYRKQIAERLGLTWTDAGLNIVHYCGGGSTFDKRNFDGRAQEMDVLHRYELTKDLPLYKELLRRGRHLDRLSEALFTRKPN